MNNEFLEALEQLEQDKGISRIFLLEAIETALLSAFKREYPSVEECAAQIDRKTGEMKIFAKKIVVEEVFDPMSEIDLESAKKINPNFQIDDICEVDATPKSFGRIAAQTAKQVIVQRIREAERNSVLNEYSEKKGSIITGLIQRVEHTQIRNVMVEIGKIEAQLSPNEQIESESYVAGKKIKVFIVDVKDDGKGTQIVISRTHPGLVKKLFEIEVPEIANGTVEIMSIAREAGSRTKIAVKSNDPNVDPIGACVGHKGARVSKILEELNGEKVDIVCYSDVPNEYIKNALAPAEASWTEANMEEKTCKVEVPASQLSLAIGKAGQNARLAAKLTGWKIDIKSAD